MEGYYLVKNSNGYLNEDEDCIGVNYGDLGEQTLAFKKEEDAKFNANNGDEIVEMLISDSAIEHFKII